jgi:hypothetical protein
MLQKFRIFTPNDQIFDPMEEMFAHRVDVPLVPGTMSYVMQCSGLTRGELEPALTDAIIHNRQIFVRCFRREKLN